MSTGTSFRLFGGSPIAEPQAESAELAAIEWETVECPLCGTREQETALVGRDFLTGRSDLFQIVRCPGCDLAFTNPRPTAQSLGLFYPKDYAPHLEREPGDLPRGRFRRSLEIARLRHRYGYPPQPASTWTAFASALAGIVIRRSRARERWVPFRAPGRLLDFGCGAGDFLRRMREYGWTVEGLDVSFRIVAALRQRDEFRVHLGTLPHPEIFAESFDAITMWHSLEHVPFPREVLRAASHSLRPGGVLAVSVPNFASWSFQRFQGHWFGLALPRHLTHFTPQTLCRMIEAAGLRVSSIEQIGRDSWIRKSARRAARNGMVGGGLAGQSRLLSSKRLVGLISRWTELTGQADTLRLIAEKA